MPIPLSSCPGLLNYNIAAAAVSKLLAGPLDAYRAPPEEEVVEEDGKASAAEAPAKPSMDIILFRGCSSSHPSCLVSLQCWMGSYWPGQW